jgi:ribose/xylose/arabinose/galactoside ABC-type transport system permease subunit
MLGQGARLYWAIQWRRNEGLGALFLVLVAFAVIYAFLFPGILAVGAMAKFVQGWFPTAMVAAAETIVMLTGGIDLSVGPMVSLGSVVAASSRSSPLAQGWAPSSAPLSRLADIRRSSSRSRFRSSCAAPPC